GGGGTSDARTTSLPTSTSTMGPLRHGCVVRAPYDIEPALSVHLHVDCRRRHGRDQMAKAYVVFTEDIRDQDGLGAYSQKAMPTIAQSGAKVLVASEDAEVLEGAWHGTRTV